MTTPSPNAAERAEPKPCPTCKRRPSERIGVYVHRLGTWNDGTPHSEQQPTKPCPDPIHDLADRLVADALVGSTSQQFASSVRLGAIDSDPHGAPGAVETPLVDELIALEKAATPAPWMGENCGEKCTAIVIGTAFANDDDDCERPLSGWPVPYSEDGEELFTPDERVCEIEEGCANPQANAALIVAVRNALPSLLSALKASARSATGDAKETDDYWVTIRDSMALKIREQAAEIDKLRTAPPSAERILTQARDETHAQPTMAMDPSHPEAYCKRCGGRNIVWFAQNPLWNEVAGDLDILCPLCFVELAEKKHPEWSRAWELRREDYTDSATHEVLQRFMGLPAVPSSGGAAVVMPQRLGVDEYMSQREAGWNACIDEVLRLNSGAASEKGETSGGELMDRIESKARTMFQREMDRIDTGDSLRAVEDVLRALEDAPSVMDAGGSALLAQVRMMRSLLAARREQDAEYAATLRGCIAALNPAPSTASASESEEK